MNFKFIFLFCLPHRTAPCVLLERRTPFHPKPPLFENPSKPPCQKHHENDLWHPRPEQPQSFDDSGDFFRARFEPSSIIRRRLPPKPPCPTTASSPAASQTEKRGSVAAAEKGTRISIGAAKFRAEAHT